MFKKYNKLNNQKKLYIFITLMVNYLISKIFAIMLFSLFYIFMINPIIDKEFNPSFFDLVNLFVFSPAGHFSIYIFFGIFLMISKFLTKVLCIETKLINSIKMNRLIINTFKKYI
ncbi:MAG: hypothetical protein A2329_05160 [Sulfurimonas sp. RIFOXYB2_FULL_37_5]|uniref:hypothetical protein n=1 Tax=Sulfurimonas sp. RIFOXYB12_FULL_35_9 TaxID=1802256 RepID=UPI0008BCE320|nr:hypothetical protein [Sulfurimonas sp. RIFOXYB12_FULL_35_9]MBS4068141.1 hypothetical protein [Sulfurimonas sp.]OHE06191.1 MAG: hypothetical protein A2345_03735 [Sulfurimonas sp. RIFOXYB12_FULL_35_9]OHE15357.1 MAG: hypothetical protein A2329_05160 [Sulfurimonas sp. RIFOXYB2_FULL_37_5]